MITAIGANTIGLAFLLCIWLALVSGIYPSSIIVSTTTTFPMSSTTILNSPPDIICLGMSSKTIANLFQFDSCVYFNLNQKSEARLYHYCPDDENLVPNQHPHQQPIEQLVQPLLNRRRSIALVQFPFVTDSSLAIVMLFSNGLYQRSLFQTNSSTLVPLNHELRKQIIKKRHQQYSLLINFSKSNLNDKRRRSNSSTHENSKTNNSNINNNKIKSITFDNETNRFYVILEQSNRITVVDQFGSIQSYNLYFSPNNNNNSNVTIVSKSYIDNNNKSSDSNDDNNDPSHNQQPIDAILFVQRKLFVLIDSTIYKVWIFKNSKSERSLISFKIVNKYSLKDFFNCYQNGPLMAQNANPKSMAGSQTSLEKEQRNNGSNILYFVVIPLFFVLAFVLIVGIVEMKRFRKQNANEGDTIDESYRSSTETSNISRYKSKTESFHKSPITLSRSRSKQTLKKKNAKFWKRFPSIFGKKHDKMEELSSSLTASTSSLSPFSNNRLCQFSNSPLLTISRLKNSLIKFANKGKLSAELKTFRLVPNINRKGSIHSLDSLVQSPIGSIKSELSVGIDDKCSLGYYSRKAPLPGGFKHSLTII